MKDNYPIGTKAFSYGGGYWIRVENGWKWPGGGVFPTPGGDANGSYELPSLKDALGYKLHTIRA